MRQSWVYGAPFPNAILAEVGLAVFRLMKGVELMAAIALTQMYIRKSGLTIARSRTATGQKAARALRERTR